MNTFSLPISLLTSNFTAFRRAVNFFARRSRSWLLCTLALLIPLSGFAGVVPFSWGNNTYGSLGNGNTVGSSVPTTVVTTGALAGKTVIAVSTGNYHSIALASDGTVYTWGDNSKGQLGNGASTSFTSAVPVAVDMTGVLAGKTVTQIAAGDFFNIVLTADGKLFSWGYNGLGDLGNNSGYYAVSLVPVAVDMTGVLAGKTVTKIAAGGVAGSGFALAVTSDGKVFGWGSDGNGELGNGGSVTTVPTAVDMTGALAGKTAVSVAAGGGGQVALLCSDGAVYAWGNNNFGQLGRGTSGGGSAVPAAVDTTGVLAGKTITAVAAGAYFSLALASDGTVYGWGADDQGQLGNSGTGTYSTPVAVTTSGALAGITISKIGTAYSTSFGLSSTGKVYSWGSNGSGELGTGGSSYSAIPVPVDTSVALSGVVVTDLANSGGSANRTVVIGLATGPVINTQPANQTVTVGAAASFTVGATGTSITYQWAKNGTPIAGATSATYSIGATALTDAGSYSVSISNTGGTAVSNSATLTVNLVAPTITGQPANQSVAVGAGASFTVSTTGASLSYQWSKNGTPISGATAASYSIVSTALTDAGSYSVSVSNTGGTVVSNSATLTVNLAAPVITTQPASQAVTVGGGVTFNVSASGTALGYQWKKAGTPIAGATSTSFNIASTALTDAGSYTVTVTNTGGSVTSNAAILTINTLAGSQSITFGAIPSHGYGDVFSLSATATSGLPVTYIVTSGPATVSGSTVTITGQGTVSIQATQAGNGSFTAAAPVTQSFAVGQGTASVTFSTLTFTFDGSPKPTSVTTSPANLNTSILYNGSGSAPSAVGSYSVTAIVNDTNYNGSTTSTLTILSAPPVITQQPASQSVFSGTNATFSVTVTSNPAATFQWTLNGTAITGATSATLTLTNISAQQAGSYRVIATNPGGSVTSNVATLSVNADQRLISLAARSLVTGGDNVAIAGFVIDGKDPRPILIRAAGPALTDLGLNGVLPRTTLTLYQGSTPLATNTGWSTATNAADIATTATNLGAFTFKAGSADSAILTTLAPGAYTAVVNGANAASGIALVEIYDSARTAPGLIDLAARGVVASGENQVFIAGFTLSGGNPKKLLIRAVGPTLSSLGVSGAMSDPMLQLYSGSTVIASNDNWGTDPALMAMSDSTGSFPSTGAFPLAATSKDAALVTTLGPGGYTVVVSGVAGSTGVVLVEVYVLP